MPSCAPSKPRRSVVVAFTLTQSTSTPNIRATFSRHTGNIGKELGFLGDDGNVTVGYLGVMRAKQFSDLCQQHHAVRTGIGIVRVWKMLADIAKGHGTQHGVHKRMSNATSASLWPNKPSVVRILHAAEHQAPAFHQAMHVIPLPYAHQGGMMRPSLLQKGFGPNRCPAGWSAEGFFSLPSVS